MARPTPVLPEVGSTIVPPGLSFPSRSAASIIASPIRSFTEPPGFRYSSFARSVHPVSRPIFWRRTIGVPPTSSRTLGNVRGMWGIVRGRRAFASGMNITTIGKGNIGGGLARRWERAGHDVTALGQDGGDASGADVVLLAVPGGAIADALGKMTGLEGKVVIDATNIFTARDERSEE